MFEPSKIETSAAPSPLLRHLVSQGLVKKRGDHQGAAYSVVRPIELGRSVVAAYADLCLRHQCLAPGVTEKGS